MQEFDVVTCSVCGIAFAVPTWFLTTRKADGKVFYCPNDHNQFYQETTVAKLQKQLAAAQRATEVARVEQKWAEEQAAKIERQRRRLAKRISAGVCPCCNRTFQDLARHMAGKHKDYALPPAAQPKQLEDGKVVTS